MDEWFEAEHHIERAHELYEAGRWDDAAIELREALARDPSRAEWHFNLGLTLEAAGRYEDALRAFASAQSLQPDDFTTLLLLGVNSLRVSNTQAAIDWLSRARKVDPSRAEPAIHLIEAHTRNHDHDRAETAFYESVLIDPDHPAAYANIAESLIERRALARAAYCLEQAIRLDASLPGLYARLAWVRSELGEHDKARELYLLELRDSPGDTETLLDFGCLLARIGRDAEASEKLRRVLEIDPGCAEAHFRLAEIAVQHHQGREAEACLSAVLKLDPRYPGARRTLAGLALDRREIALARKHLRAELLEFRRRPVSFSPEDLLDLADLLLSAHLPADALVAAENAVERDRSSSEAWHMLGVCAFSAGNTALGIDAERRSLRLGPPRIAALHNLALAAVRARDWGRAERFIAHALSLDGDDDSIRRLRLMLRIGRLSASLRWLLGRR